MSLNPKARTWKFRRLIRSSPADRIEGLGKSGNTEIVIVISDYINYSGLVGEMTRRGKPRLYGKLFSNTVPQQLFGSQQLIHRAGAESLQIEGYEFESKSFEHGGELAGHLGG